MDGKEEELTQDSQAALAAPPDRKTEHTRYIKTIAKGAGYGFLGLAVGRLLGYLTRLVLARFLGPQDYGLLSIASAIIAVAAAIPLAGIPTGVTRFVSKFMGEKQDGKIREIIAFSLFFTFIVSLLTSAAIFLSAPLLASAFKSPALVLPIRLMAGSIPLLSVILVSGAALAAFKAIKPTVYLHHIVQPAAKLLFAAALLYLGYGLVGVALGQTLGALIAALFGFLYLDRKVFHFFERQRIVINRELLAFSLPLLLSNIILILIIQVDTIMLGYLKEAADVGIYNASLIIAQTLFVIPQGVAALFLPLISELYAKKEAEEVKRLYGTTTKWIFLISFPYALFLFTFSSDIIFALFGKEYIAGSLALKVLSAGYLISAILYTSYDTLNMLGKTRQQLLVVVAVLLTATTLNFILIPTYGLLGAAMATSLGGVLQTLGMMAFSYAYLRTNPLRAVPARAVLAGAVSVSLVGLAYGLLPGILLLKLSIAALLLCVSYAALLRLLGSLDEDDISILRAMRNRLRTAGAPL